MGDVMSRSFRTSQTSNSSTDFSKTLGIIQNGLNSSSSKSSLVDTKKADSQDSEKIASQVNGGEATKTEYGNSKTVQASTDKQDLAKDDVKMQEDVKEIEAKIKKALSELLGISEEEISAIMATMNITFTDLFQTENLMMFLNEVVGIEEISVLTDANMYVTFKDVRKALDNILEEAAKTLNMDAETLVKQFNSEKTVVAVEPQTDEALDTEEAVPLNKDEQKIVTTDLRTKQTDESSMDKDFSSNKQPKQGSKEGISEQSQTGFVHLSSQQINEDFDFSIQANSELRTVEVPATEIIDQIVDQMRFVLDDEGQTIMMKLNPEHLGKISLSLVTDKGSMTGQIVAENQTVKEAIEMNLSLLKANLNEQGIKVNEIKVVIGNAGEFYNQSDAKQQSQQFAKSKRKKVSMEVVEAIEQRIQTLENTLNDMGLTEPHSVDFSA